jgi:nitrogenase molybdenum-iron protein NifN
VFEKKVALYGDDDLVVALARFCAEIGMIPVICASSSDDKRLVNALQKSIPEIAPSIKVITSADFDTIEEHAMSTGVDLFIGSSKGYPIAKKLGVPLIRVGFPIHDRFGGQRTLHVGYRGTQNLFDRVVNALLERKQETGGLGYAYL